MINTLILWLIGLALIYVEFFVPGAVFAVLGGILIVGSIALFATQTSVLATSLLVLASIMGIWGVIRFALWSIRTAKPKSSIFSDDQQAGYKAQGFDEALIGKEGSVVTDLKPSGRIEVHGKEYQAVSQSGYLTSGKKIIVVSGEENTLIVKQKKE